MIPKWVWAYCSLLALGALCLVFVFGFFVGRASGSISSASYYGPGLYGNKTSCGQTLTPSTYGVAHRTLPCGTRIRICRLYRCITTNVVDHGPYVYSRDLDLTAASARQLCGCPLWGVWLVAWQVL